MSQESIINYLKKCKMPKTVKQIKNALKISNSGNVHSSLAKLYKWGEVDYIVVSGRTRSGSCRAWRVVE
jgi:SOS-response transcriptional repressor LexA